MMVESDLASYSMFEYEKVLAEREFASLARSAESTGADVASVLRERATYFGTVDGEQTDQAVTEATHHQKRGSRPSRQATRYLVHGLHEYKGKFNPQTARALINAVDPAAQTLLDPFCGSGTTLVEGMRLGMSVAGIDQNPLARWISHVKVEAQRLAGEDGLVAEFDRIVERMRAEMKERQGSMTARAPEGVSADDEAYLRRWFPEPVLAALWGALRLCRTDNSVVGQVAEVCLSNIVRDVSWQLPEDLRVRRRGSEWEPPQVADVFANSAERGRLALHELQRARGIPAHIEAEVRLGSSRDSSTVASAWAGGRRIVVTSPPYATALPYIDTDRLSIVLLGLASSGDIRRLEHELTGSREWVTREAKTWEGRREENFAGLPSSIMSLLDSIDENNRETGAGFRRAAVPNLLYRYFAQMRETLASLSGTMDVGEYVVMVVGANRTGSGTHKTTIKTPELIGELSTTVGFRFAQLIPLETWARYGMHSKNAVDVEQAVVMAVDR